ncbi:hypothetical protein BJ741DRAFT_77545 [Chytriomyces cf. hyalinus JEL632]|nr:hypothetical protein BJ741DRAFT_77545 [Chytriomyces cf. hyalinus JEL632]
MRSLTLFRTPNLVELNLSCNNIREIEGLESLVSLHRLILSFNKITSLQGIADAASSKLYYMDLKGNLINDFAQLEYLAVIPSLKELVLKSSDPSSTIINPICKHPQYSHRVLQILPFISHLDNPTIQSFPDLEAEFEFSDPIIEHKMPQDASSDSRLFHRLERIEETMHSLAHNQPSHPPQHHKNKLNEDPGNTTNAQMIQYFQAVLDKLDQTRIEVHRRDHVTSIGAESDVTAAAARERILSLEAKVASLGKSLNERVHADALRTEALGMMVQAAPSDDESTDGGATIPIKIPTRIPKPSEPGRKLVWKQQNPSVKAEPTQLDQTKPSSHTSGSTNPQTTQPVTSDNMAALLKSLETEKQKYSDDERRYASEIVALNEKLAFAEANASEEKKTRMHVQESIQALQESAALKAENHALILKEVNQSLEKETAAKQSAEQAAKLLEQKLEECQNQVKKTLVKSNFYTLCGDDEFFFFSVGIDCLARFIPRS